jgi:hypothetical protein
MPPHKQAYRDASDLEVGDTVVWVVGGASRIMSIEKKPHSGAILVTFEGGSQTWFDQKDRVPIAGPLA